MGPRTHVESWSLWLASSVPVPEKHRLRWLLEAHWLLGSQDELMSQIQ